MILLHVTEKPCIYVFNAYSLADMNVVTTLRLDKIIAWCHAQWMLAFITLIGNRKHDEDGDSRIKVYSQGHYGDILLLDWSFVFICKDKYWHRPHRHNDFFGCIDFIGTKCAVTEVSFVIMAHTENKTTCDGSVICHHGSHRKQNNLEAKCY